MSMTFYVTDVFAEGPYAGNQLATLPNAASLSTEEMQKIARAFNFAETTFIVGGSLASGYDVRIFTPMSELPFAGHPTLGTSYLIRHVLPETIKEAGPVKTITLNLGVGSIPVEFGDDGVLWMTQKQPVFAETFKPGDVAQALGLSIDDIDENYPCQMVSTGLSFLLVPLVSYDALKRAKVVGESISEPCFIFCKGGYNDEQQIRARMFAGGLGVPEDPATGSANGCLAGYLSLYELLGSSRVDIRVGQGYEIARPSQLYLRSQPHDGEIMVRVGGKVSLVASGQWLI